MKAPIPSCDHIEPFLEAGIPDLWTYYCCAQCREVSNRFIAMPSSRTRIIGAQLWKYRIAGFLHWGYNYWYTRFSRRAVDPFVLNDGGSFTPAGDCFSVYPGPDGTPYQSLHMKAFTEALSDLRAMSLAESLCGSRRGDFAHIGKKLLRKRGNRCIIKKEKGNCSPLSFTCEII